MAPPPLCQGRLAGREQAILIEITIVHCPNAAGSGKGAAVLFARVDKGLKMTAADFFVIRVEDSPSRGRASMRISPHFRGRRKAPERL